MTVQPATRLGAMTGERYVESLRDGREVWFDGQRVDDVTTHPAFRDMVHALADVYDKQNSEYRDEMTYVDPESGVRTSLSWLIAQLARGLPTQAAQQPVVEPADVGSARSESGRAGAVHRQPDESARRVRRRPSIRAVTSPRTSPVTTAFAATTTSS